MIPVKPVDRGEMFLRVAVGLTLALAVVDCYLLFRSLVESHVYRGGGPLYLLLGYKLLKRSRRAYVAMLKLLPFVVSGVVALGAFKVVEAGQMAAAGVVPLMEFSNAWVSALSSNVLAIELILLIGILATIAHQDTRSMFDLADKAGPRWALYLPPRKWLLPPVVALTITVLLSGPHLFQNPFVAVRAVVTSHLTAEQGIDVANAARTLGIRNWSHLSAWKIATGGHSRVLKARVNLKGAVTMEEPRRPP